MRDETLIEQLRHRLDIPTPAEVVEYFKCGYEQAERVLASMAPMLPLDVPVKRPRIQKIDSPAGVRKNKGNEKSRRNKPMSILRESEERAIKDVWTVCNEGQEGATGGDYSKDVPELFSGVSSAIVESEPRQGDVLFSEVPERVSEDDSRRIAPEGDGATREGSIPRMQLEDGSVDRSGESGMEVREVPARPSDGEAVCGSPQDRGAQILDAGAGTHGGQSDGNLPVVPREGARTRQDTTVPIIPVIKWTGCYGKSWKGFVHEDSFVHPAKYSRLLIERIIRHGLQRGYWHLGGRIRVTDTLRKEIIDEINAGEYIPRACHSLERSNQGNDGDEQQSLRQDTSLQTRLRSEPSLFENTEQTASEHGLKSPSPMNGCQEQSGAGCPPPDQSLTDSLFTISTKTNSMIGSKISPSLSEQDIRPVTESSLLRQEHGNNTHLKPSNVRDAKENLRERSSTKTAYARRAELFLADRQKLVTSNGYVIEGSLPNIGQEIERQASIIGDCFGGVGLGGVAATYFGMRWIGRELEPKFYEIAGRNFEMHRATWENMGRTLPVIQLGDSRKFDEIVSAIATSPPFTADQPCASQSSLKGEIGGRAKREHGMTDPDNIQGLKHGELSAAITSPPYNLPFSQDHPETGGGKRGTNPAESGAFVKYGSTDQQIEGLPNGTVDAAITSPPYDTIHAGAGGLNHLPPRGESDQGGRTNGASQQADTQYGDTPGQIAKTVKGSLDAAVTSPPWEEGATGHVGADRFGDPVAFAAKMAESSSSKAHSNTAEARERQLERDKGKTYGDSAGQIGKLKRKVDGSIKSSRPRETYFEAMKLVYEACYRCLKPGGYMAVVVKDYCRKKKRVCLCDDTLRLLVFVGFRPVERIHAMLVEDVDHHPTDLFGAATGDSAQVSRKSFFKRVHESRPGAVKIDYEEVLICRKPV